MVTLNTAYVTASGRIFRALHFVYSADADGNIVKCLSMAEDVFGKPLPVMHCQPIELIEKLLIKGDLIKKPIEYYYQQKRCTLIYLDIVYR